MNHPGATADLPDAPHAMAAGDVLAALAADRRGLSSEDAAHRLDCHGPNAPPRASKPGALLRFLAQFNHILIYVLIGAAAFTYLLGHPIDTTVILAVVLANAVIGFVQEGSAERAMAAIQGMRAANASVLRDGRRVSIDSTHVVPGDIVLLGAGDKPPADMRLIQARGIQAQEAILTGRSVAVDKGIATSGGEALSIIVALLLGLSMHPTTSIGGDPVR